MDLKGRIITVNCNGKCYYRGLDAILHRSQLKQSRGKTFNEILDIIDAIMDKSLFEYIMSNEIYKIYNLYMIISSNEIKSCDQFTVERTYKDTCIKVEDLTINVIRYSQYERYELSRQGKSIEYERLFHGTDHNGIYCDAICKKIVGERLSCNIVKSAILQTKSTNSQI